MNSSIHGGLVKFLVFLGVIWSFYGACKEFYNIAWGTGNWLGEFSLKWMVVFLLFEKNRKGCSALKFLSCSINETNQQKRRNYTGCLPTFL